MKRVISCVLLMLVLTSNAFALEVPTGTVVQNLNGSQQAIKTFTVSPEQDPATLIEEPFELEGYLYTFADIVKSENPVEEKRIHTEVITVETTKDDLALILEQLKPTIEYDDGRFQGTMQAKAMKLMASKLAVAGIIEGTFSEEGLAAMSDVKDLTSQMAKELALGIRDNVEDIAAAFRKMAVMNPERKKNITAAQPKETAAEEQKAPAAKDSFGVRTAQAQVRQALYEGLLARTAEEQKKRKSKKAEVDENQLSIFGFAA